jgi:uncharacterized membrane protein
MKYIPASLFAIGILLRALLIWQAPLWYDENFTYLLTQLSLPGMMQAVMGDVHPPLWYLIEWITFHGTPWPAWAMRIPALIFSILSLVAFWRITEEMITPRYAQLAAFGLMALLPAQLWYAQEARMYAMLEFFVLAAFYNAIKRRWVLFTLSAIGMLYSQNYGLFYLAAIWLAVQAINPKDNMEKMTVACAIAFIVFCPWLELAVFGQMDNIAGRYWIMDSSPAAALVILQRSFFVSVLDAPIAIAATMTIFAALILGIWFLVRSDHPFRWSLLVMAFAPLAMAMIVSLVWQPVILSRPIIGSAPFLYLIAAWPLVERRTRVMLYAACYVIPLLVAGDLSYFTKVSEMKDSGEVRPLGDVLEYVTAHFQTGDVIYHTDDGSMINFLPYSDLPQYRMPDCAPVLGGLSDATRAAIPIHIAELETISHTRAWVLAPTLSPLHPQCYYEKIAPLTSGTPVMVIDDNEYMQSGLWLVVNGGR